MQLYYKEMWGHWITTGKAQMLKKSCNA
jgi:hypothetical protein